MVQSEVAVPHTPTHTHSVTHTHMKMVPRCTPGHHVGGFLVSVICGSSSRVLNSQCRARSDMGLQTPGGGGGGF